MPGKVEEAADGAARTGGSGRAGSGGTAAARRGERGAGQETRQGRSAASRYTHFRLTQAQRNKRIFSSPCQALDSILTIQSDPA